MSLIHFSRLEKFAVGIGVISAIAANRAAQAWLEEAEARVPIDTGTLAASGSAHGNEVVFDADYAGFVEYGPNARPFFRPAEMVVRKRFAEDLTTELRKEA